MRWGLGRANLAGKLRFVAGGSACCVRHGLSHTPPLPSARDEPCHQSRRACLKRVRASGVAQVSKPAVSPTSKSAARRQSRAPWKNASLAGLETRDPADLEVCATAAAPPAGFFRQAPRPRRKVKRKSRNPFLAMLYSPVQNRRPASAQSRSCTARCASRPMACRRAGSCAIFSTCAVKSATSSARVM